MLLFDMLPAVESYLPSQMSIEVIEYEFGGKGIISPGLLKFLGRYTNGILCLLILHNDWDTLLLGGLILGICLI